MLELTDDCIAAAEGRVPIDDKGRTPTAIRVFKNDFMEHYVARAHWVTPIFWFGPVIAYGAWRGFAAGFGAAAVAGWFVLGWLLWTLIEYLMHRYLFHLTWSGPSGPMRHFLMHGYHHEFPNDPMRLVAPPIMSFGPALLFGTAWYLLFGPAVWTTVFAGTCAGYVAYDWIHYYAHHGRPRGGLGKWIRRYHMVHHFKEGDTRYGVSSPLWDFVFATAGAAR